MVFLSVPVLGRLLTSLGVILHCVSEPLPHKAFGGFRRILRLAMPNTHLQKQLVQCAADVIRSHIVEKEIGGEYFSLLVDEVSCEAKSEHMAIVVRFVSKLTRQITEIAWFCPRKRYACCYVIWL
ncbi:hypothetical protein PF005_g3754 [Phytophthora fragariae]|uniref:DUF4371 domain-containing protein n=1 Tax=Phytophthora fragariae TaxID=53985 RepID=A0A6A3M948_9STRA|nr:hypothetical protein PF003_g39051 [Phytophthora fragariae]KAE8947599.1 hypothetical protein PF009_g2801 [Phytophthora fragariae]KAE9024974.1 hypothetical protein PF011_g3258 [Phytophthora fragariae]KAE9131646.1 hypothetical protein PF010_g3451 [Phytophthora fragariae]KAE9132914.1 hypothetical protein PF007_g3547 [Phytophthora fragariae]